MPRTWLAQLAADFIGARDRVKARFEAWKGIRPNVANQLEVIAREAANFNVPVSADGTNLSFNARPLPGMTEETLLGPELNLTPDLRAGLICVMYSPVRRHGQEMKNEILQKVEPESLSPPVIDDIAKSFFERALAEHPGTERAR